MHSLRAKITILTLCVAVVTVIAVTLLSVLFIVNTEQQQSEQTLLLLCETGARNLDYYFSSVEKSVRMVTTFVDRDLEGLDEAQLEAHTERVRNYFDIVAHKTNGVLTYYYRIDPEISKTVKGFWYTDLEGEGFTEHAVTDITLYDTSDTSSLVWFTVPKYEGASIWLPPYITDNLDKRVISYNTPIYWRGTFVGVIGIEIDYSIMAEQVDSIRLFRNAGYAFLNDDAGNLIFHPRIDVTAMSAEERPKAPSGMVSSSTFISYTFNGEDKEAAWLPLSNGMRLNVCAPVSEMDGDWEGLVRRVIIVSAIVLLLMSLVALYFTGHITKPLQQLTEAAGQIDKGNFDFTLEYDRDDEVGRLTRTFKRLAAHVKDQVTDLSKRAYVDALTSVRNKGAFASYLDELQEKLDAQGGDMNFAVGMFDCDDLKRINDSFGHDKGDIYLKTASRLICRVFQHSPVFRVGGDEFAVILFGDDYRNRESLVTAFRTTAEHINASTENQWEQIRVSLGVAVYDPALDKAVIDAVRRADKLMYANKRARKENV